MCFHKILSTARHYWACDTWYATSIMTGIGISFSKEKASTITTQRCYHTHHVSKNNPKHLSYVAIIHTMSLKIIQNILAVTRASTIRRPIITILGTNIIHMLGNKKLIGKYNIFNCVLYKIDWVQVLCPTRHKIGHFGDALPNQSLGLVLKNENKQQKQTCTHNEIYYNLKLTQKTKPSLVASYDLQPPKLDQTRLSDIWQVNCMKHMRHLWFWPIHSNYVKTWRYPQNQ